MTTTDVHNPADGSVLTTLTLLDAEAVDDAVARARTAQRAWARLAPAGRGEAMRAFSGVVRAHVEELAALEVANSGHPIGQARWEAGHVADVLTYYAAAPERLFGRQIPVAGGVDLTFAEPIGVVGVITPWNFPMTIASWGFAPALAAGNAVLVKPAEWTPLTTIRLGELASEAGLPAGLLQVLPGKGSVLGERLVTHPGVGKVVFTGSTTTGARVMAAAAPTITNVTLELGGKSANVVFADADLERAAATAPYGVFDNAGQDCCARSRILVQESAYERFMELLEPAVAGVRVGDPGDETTEMGPLVSAPHLAKVASYVPDDAPVAFRGSAPDGPGYWFAPTVLTPSSRTDRTVVEEIFGPVVTVQRFRDEADAIALANDTAYGLSGSIWTRDVSRAMRVARAVEAGNLSVNSHASVRYSTPFGGFKQSGIGRELGPDAPFAFTETKNVFLAVEDGPGSNQHSLAVEDGPGSNQQRVLVEEDPASEESA
ncbi:aldehyde dehydrogenase family protein [Mumia sp. ZJ430]|uniref:aldehyde dehydrogenase family protein n=1 Tax=Mumia sp. ZJ430 TaxID=2708083 RepID=UPI001424861F|nr:aldehyde dehydrogenase family protein [Mumia sp. ZJ430]